MIFDPNKYLGDTGQPGIKTTLSPKAPAPEFDPQRFLVEKPALPSQPTTPAAPVTFDPNSYLNQAKPASPAAASPRAPIPLPAGVDAARSSTQPQDLSGAAGAALNRGSLQATQAYYLIAAMGGLDTADEIAKARAESRVLRGTQAYEAFGQSKTAGETVSRIVKNPVDILSQLFLESLASYGKTSLPLVMAGAKGGAAVGTAIEPGVGTAIGGALGIRAGAGIGSLVLESTSEFLDFLDEQGINTTDAASLREAFQDPTLMREGRNIALAKGIPVAIFDAISAGVAGHLVKNAAGKPLMSRLWAIAAESFVEQPAFGMAGEAAGQVASRGKITDPAGVVAEGFAELPGGAAEVATGFMSRGNADKLNPVTRAAEALKRIGISEEAATRFNALTPDERAEAIAMVGAQYDPATVDSWIKATTPEARIGIRDAYRQRVEAAQAAATSPGATTAAPGAEPAAQAPGAITIAPDAQSRLDALVPQLETRMSQPMAPGRLTAVDRPTDPARETETRAAENAALLFGKSVVWFKDNNPEQGAFAGTVTGDTVFVSVDAKNPYQSVTMHETLHRMKQTAPDLYGQLLAVAQEEGTGFDAFRKTLMDRYEAQGITPGKDDSWAWEELVAETVGERGTSKKFWTDLYDKSPDVVKKLVETITNVMDAIRGIEATPEIAQFYKDFQRVHDTAVTVMSEYAKREAAPAVTAETEAQNGLSQEAQGRQGQTLLNKGGAPGPETPGAPAPLSVEERDIVKGKTVEFTPPGATTIYTGTIQQRIDDKTVRVQYKSRQGRGTTAYADVPIDSLSNTNAVTALRARNESLKDLSPAERRKVEADAREADKILQQDPETAQMESYRQIEMETTPRGKAIAESKWKKAMRASTERELKMDPGETLADVKTRAKYLPQIRDLAYRKANYAMKPDAPHTFTGKRGDYEAYFDGKKWHVRSSSEGRYMALQPNVPLHAKMIAALESNPHPNIRMMVDQRASQPHTQEEAAIPEGNDLPFSVERKASITPEQDARYLKLAKDPEGNKQGNVIPLSKRFNPASQDIRLSVESDIADELFGPGKKESPYVKKAAMTEDRLSPEFRAAIKQKIEYEVKPQADTTERAVDWITKQGSVEKARLRIIANETDNLTTDEIAAAGEGLYHLYDDAAKAEKDPQRKTDIYERAIQLFEHVSENNIRGAARTLSYLRTWGKTMADPAGARAIANRIMRQANSKQFTEKVEAEQKDVSQAASDEVTRLVDELLRNNEALKTSINLAESRAKSAESEQRRLQQEADTRSKYVRAETKNLIKHRDRFVGLNDRETSDMAKARERIKQRLSGQPISVEYGAMLSVENPTPGESAIPDDLVSDLITYGRGFIASMAKSGKAATLNDFTKLARSDFGEAISAKADIAHIFKLAEETYVENAKAYADQVKTVRKQERATKKPGSKVDAGLQQSLDDWAATAGTTPETQAAALSKMRKQAKEKLAESNLVAWAEERGITDAEGIQAIREMWEQASKVQTKNELVAWAKDVSNSGLTEQQISDLFETLPWKSAAAADIASKLAPSTITPRALTESEQRSKNAALIKRIGLVRKTLGDIGVSVSEILQQHLGQREATKQSLVDRLVNQAKLTPAEATKLADRVSAEFNKLIDAKAKQLLERRYLVDNKGKRHVVTRTVIGDIVTALKLGATADEAVADAFAAKIGLARMTPAIKQRLIQMSDKIQQAITKYGKDSIQAQEAQAETMKYIGSQIPRGFKDVASAWIHFSLLSGPPTHAVNMAANWWNRQSVTLVKFEQAMMDRRKDPDALRKFFYAVSIAKQSKEFARAEAKYTVATGFSRMTEDDKYGMDPAHMNPFEVDPVLSKGPMKYVRRFLAAEDLLSRIPLQEMQAALLMADTVQREEGLTGKKLMERVSERMGYSNAEQVKYRAQAQAEGLTGVNLERRIFHLMEAARPRGLNERAIQFGQKESFNTRVPGGILGSFAAASTRIANNHPTMKPFALFARIVANTSNMALEYSPHGFVRAWQGKIKLPDGKVHEFDTTERRDVLYKAFNGTTLTLAATALAWSALKDWEEDPDKDKKAPWFEATAQGPTNTDQRAAWFAQGNKPYTIRVNGGPVISYAWMASVAIPLTIAGAWMDYQRYNKPQSEDDNQDHTGRLVASMLYGITRYFLETAPVASGNTFLRTLNDPNESSRTAKLAQFFAGFTGFVIPNAVLQTAKFMDPTKYRADDIWDGLAKNVPVVRGVAMYPSLNILGDKTEDMPSDRFFKSVKDDPELKFIVDNDLPIQPPDRGDPYYDPATQKMVIATELEYYTLTKEFGHRFRELLSTTMPMLKGLKDQAQLKKQVAFIRSLAAEEAKVKLLERRYEDSRTP